MKLAVALLLLALSACTRPYWQTDEVVLGVEVDFGVQQDREALDEVLITCANIIGDGRLLAGARVKFVEDNDAVERACWPAPPNRGEIAGCWSIALDDMVILAAASRLADTALCHELAHRARYFAKGQVAGAEDSAHCDRALWQQLNVPTTGACPP